MDVRVMGSEAADPIFTRASTDHFKYSLCNNMFNFNVSNVQRIMPCTLVVSQDLPGVFSPDGCFVRHRKIYYCYRRCSLAP
jgi:hypothetical protein